MYYEKKRRFIASLMRVPPDGVDCKFHVGQLVKFTNDYGVSFDGQRIIGFSEPVSELSGSPYIYLDNSSYWFPCTPESLTESALTQAMNY